MSIAHTFVARHRRKIVFTTAALAIGFSIYAGIQTYARWQLQGVFFFDWLRTEETQKAKLKVGDTIFHIPKNYFYSRAYMGDGDIKGFNIEVLLPDLTPYNESLKYEFNECRGWCRRIHIGVGLNNYQNSRLDTQIQRRVKDAVDKGRLSAGFQGVPTDLGLAHYPDFGWEGYLEGYMYSDPSMGTLLVYECAKEKEKPAPGCHAYLFYKPGILVEYSHHRKYLPQWREIREKVLGLLSSFDQTASKSSGR